MDLRAVRDTLRSAKMAGDPRHERLRQLLCCAMSAEGVDVPEASTGIDQGLIPLLNDHRLSPLLGFGLNRAGLEAQLATELRQHLQQAYRVTLLHNQQLRSQLQVLLPALHERGILPIVLKGMHLALDYYPDLGCRPMTDLDLLIPEQAKEEAREVLRQQGLVPRIPANWSPAQERADSFAGQQGITVDLHYVFDLFDAETRSDLVQGCSFSAAQGSLQAFAPEPLLAHLAVHLWGHRPKQGDLLFWVCDLAVVLDRAGAGFDLSLLESLIPGAGARQHLWRCLGLLEELGCFAWPEAWADRRPVGDAAYTLAELLALRGFRSWHLDSWRGRWALALARWFPRRAGPRWIPASVEPGLARDLLGREAVLFSQS